jgi:hypothetical protein
MAAWKLPLVVSAIALPIVAGFYVGGPGLGMAVGAVAIASLAENAALAGALPEVLLIAPCRGSFAERWTSDLEPGRQRAEVDLKQGAALLGSRLPIQLHRVRSVSEQAEGRPSARPVGVDEQHRFAEATLLA